jgi:hypothetical protein
MEERGLLKDLGEDGEYYTVSYWNKLSGRWQDYRRSPTQPVRRVQHVACDTEVF